LGNTGSKLPTLRFTNPLFRGKDRTERKLVLPEKQQRQRNENKQRIQRIQKIFFDRPTINVSYISRSTLTSANLSLGYRQSSSISKTDTILIITHQLGYCKHHQVWPKEALLGSKNTRNAYKYI